MPPQALKSLIMTGVVNGMITPESRNSARKIRALRQGNQRYDLTQGACEDHGRKEIQDGLGNQDAVIAADAGNDGTINARPAGAKQHDSRHQASRILRGAAFFQPLLQPGAAAASAVDSESPPSAKKSSQAPTRSTRSTFSKARQIASSWGVAGGM